MKDGRHPNRVVVIGYGNELRGDDGLGAAVARAIDDWHWPGVQGIARHQLVPELAEVLADSHAVFFVDACLDPSFEEVSVTPMSPSPQAWSGGHVSNPQELLALSQILYHQIPQAWWVRVRVDDLRLGSNLSERACRNLNATLSILRPLLTGLSTESPPKQAGPSSETPTGHA